MEAYTADRIQLDKIMVTEFQNFKIVASERFSNELNSFVVIRGIGAKVLITTNVTFYTTLSALTI